MIILLIELCSNELRDKYHVDESHYGMKKVERKWSHDMEELGFDVGRGF